MRIRHHTENQVNATMVMKNFGFAKAKEKEVAIPNPYPGEPAGKDDPYPEPYMLID